MKRSIPGASRLFVQACIAALLLGSASAQTLPVVLGDFDADGTPTVADLVRLINHLKADPVLPAPLAPFADLDQNGIVDVADVEHLTAVILEREPQTPLPIAHIDQSSPASGDGNVAVTREFIIRFSTPLAANAIVGIDHFYAQYAGRTLLGRVEISSDRLKATLFHQENLPSSARVRVTFDADGVSDYLGRVVDADGDGQPGGKAEFDFDTVNITPVASTGMVGTIYAAKLGGGGGNVPLQGVIIEIVGDEDNTRTTTAADGSFALSPVPAGDFFVNVDGRLVTGGFPDAGYYPFVRKVWSAKPGRGDNLAAGTGEIFLPFIRPGTLQTVSATQSTPIGLPPAVIAANPEFSGVSITVPANSLFGDDGSRGGKVGLAPVPPDRLPEPLPSGLGLPLVITVQTDGASNFDRPATVRFPNTPDPGTGDRLPAGSKSALWSFNHDTGGWELQGPMTVSVDGNWIDSDPGVGIKQPGWHGQSPSSRLFNPTYSQSAPAIGKCGSTRENQISRAKCLQDGVAAVGSAVGLKAACSGTPVGFGLQVFGKYFFCKQLSNLHDPGVAQEIFQACWEFYSECNLAPETNQDRGGLAKNARGKAKDGEDTVEALFDSTRTLLGSIIEDLSVIESFYEMARELIGDSEPDELTPEQERQLTEIAASLTLFLEGKTEKEFFRSRMILLDQFKNAIGVEFDLRTDESGYYAIEDLATGFVVRGRTDRQGAVGGVPVRPNSPYRTRIIFPKRVGVYIAEYLTADIGQDLAAPRGILGHPTPDSDDDGLEDSAEFVLGTNPDNPDSDNDGVTDGAEIAQGTDPLDDLPVATGVIASGPTAAAARDVCAVNDTIIVACGFAGVTVFDVSAGLTPVRVAEVDTPGSAEAVACFGNLIAVADGPGGLAIIDTSDPPAASILHRLPFASPAKAVTVHGAIAFVGMENGTIAAVDLPTGTLLSLNREIGAPIQDLALAGDYLYALEVGQLDVFEIVDGQIARVANLPLPEAQGAGGRRLRLFIGDRFALATHRKGYIEFDITKPAQPVYLRQNDTAQFGWKQIVANGSGLAIAAVGNTSDNGGPHHIDLYGIAPDGADGIYITTIQTPGLASAVTLYNGFAYIADSSAGLQVVNYLAFDALGQAPTVTLTSSAVAGEFEEGKVMRATAAVTDDVQVRNVQFFIDGELALTDGNFPFAMRFVTPILADGISRFTLKSIATDTGGNTAESAELTINLVPDATPPRVRRTLPGNGGVVGQIQSVTIFMSEAIDAVTIAGDSLSITHIGGLSGPQIQSIDYRDTLNSLVVEFEEPLEPGGYEITVRAPLADLAGIPFAEPFRFTFLVYGFADLDLDGIPDNVESALGLDPLNPDSDGDGIADGAEDFDNDGLANAGEFPVGANPTDPDTDNDGTLDGAGDADFDALNDQQEFVRGTDPNKVDSDGDGWSDEAEVTVGSDPLNPLSRPLSFVVSTRRVRSHRTAADPVARGNFFLGEPSTTVRRTAPDPVQWGDFHLGKPLILIDHQ